MELNVGQKPLTCLRQPSLAIKDIPSLALRLVRAKLVERGVANSLLAMVCRYCKPF